MSVYNDKKYKYISNLVKKRKYNEALYEVKKYREEYPRDIKGKYLYAYIIEGMGEIKKAAKIYNELVHGNDNIRYNCLYRLGMIDLAANNNQEAKEKFYEIINKSPYEEASAYMALIEIELSNNNFTEAMNIIDSFKGCDDRITLAKAQLYLILEQDDLSLKTLDSIIDKKEIDVSRKIDIIKGRIASKKGDYYSAKELFQHSLIGPRNSRYYSNKLEIARHEKRFQKYDEAIEICDEVICNEKKHIGKALLIKGDCYLGKNEYDNAEEMYKFVLENFEEKKNKSCFKLGFLMFIQRKYDQAIKYFKNVSEKSKEYEKAVFYIAVSYLRLNEYLKADFYAKKLHDNSRLKILIDVNLGRKVTPKGYTEMQLCNYSLKKAIKHSARTHENNGEKTMFRKDISIQNLFLEVKNKLVPSNLICGDLFDQYQINYENCGYVNDKIANAIEVVVEPMSKHIITMYPVYNIKIAEDNYKPVSRIDKFNKKYGLKK